MYLCDIGDIEAFLKQDDTNHYKYKKEKMDCDNFTFRLMGQFSTPAWAPIVKGIVWDYGHAFMICIDANLDVWSIEPQADGLTQLNQLQNVRFIIL